MPFVFYNAAAPGGRLAVLGPDQSTIDFELRDVSAAASGITYAPAEPLAWAVPPPDDVAEALDELANFARANRVSHIIPSPTNVFPYIFDSPNFFVPVKSGRYLLWGQAGGTINSSQQVAFSLRVDGVAAAQSNCTTQTPFAAAFNLSCFTLVTMDRTTSHSVGGNLGVTGGEINAGFFRWMCFEL